MIKSRILQLAFLAPMLFAGLSFHAGGQDPVAGVSTIEAPRESETAPAAVAPDPIQERVQATRQAALLGRWQAAIGSQKLTLTFNNDGTYSLNEDRGPYRVESSQLILGDGEVEAAYTFEFKDQNLTLSGGGLAAPVVYQRAADLAPQFDSLLSVSPKKMRARAVNIGKIILVVVFCRLLLWGLESGLHWLVTSRWGVLKYAYRNRKNRAMTIQSIVVNLAKYVVYFTALGFILTELGINYRVYIASLSVVGLAVGFGSQGLVQDVVTGLGLVFENQFDVGDMVEISGQTGIVEGLGLRVTRLRNYLGQLVMIPNRNITVVGRYPAHALLCTIDIGVPAAVEPDVLKELVNQTTREVKHQFEDVILRDPYVLGPLEGPAGSALLRLRLSLWPQQQWVIDQQLLPRLREQLKQKEWEIPADRMAVYYASPL